jgi:hypothetical protein
MSAAMAGRAQKSRKTALHLFKNGSLLPVAAIVAEKPVPARSWQAAGSRRTHTMFRSPVGASCMARPQRPIF